MALAIRTIPTLYGKEAEVFEACARNVEAHPGKIRISHRTQDAVRKMMMEAELNGRI